MAERKPSTVAQDEILAAVDKACLERFPDAITVVDYNDLDKVRVTMILKKGQCGSMAAEPPEAITEVEKWLDEMESKLPS